MAAMNVTSACFYLGSGMRSVHGVKVFASENLAVSKTEEDKVKLGGSDLKVSRLGLGAWSWGDTGYWNNSEWDGKKFNLLLKIYVFDWLVRQNCTVPSFF